MTPAERVLAALDAAGFHWRAAGADRWMAACLAHDDRTPSLSLRRGDDRTLVRCFAGCETGDVLAALDLDWTDLFDGLAPRRLDRRPRPAPEAKPPDAPVVLDDAYLDRIRAAEAADRRAGITTTTARLDPAALDGDPVDLLLAALRVLRLDYRPGANSPDVWRVGCPSCRTPRATMRREGDPGGPAAVFCPAGCPEGAVTAATAAALEGSVP